MLLLMGRLSAGGRLSRQRRRQQRIDPVGVLLFRSGRCRLLLLRLLLFFRFLMMMTSNNNPSRQTLKADRIQAGRPAGPCLFLFFHRPHPRKRGGKSATTIPTCRPLYFHMMDPTPDTMASSGGGGKGQKYQRLSRWRLIPHGLFSRGGGWCCLAAVNPLLLPSATASADAMPFILIFGHPHQAFRLFLSFFLNIYWT